METVGLRAFALRVWRTLTAPHANAVVAFLCAALFGYDAWRFAQAPDAHSAAGLALVGCALWSAVGVRCALQSRDGALHDPDDGHLLSLHLRHPLHAHRHH